MAPSATQMPAATEASDGRRSRDRPGKAQHAADVMSCGPDTGQPRSNIIVREDPRFAATQAAPEEHESIGADGAALVLNSPCAAANRAWLHC